MTDLADAPSLGAEHAGGAEPSGACSAGVSETVAVVEQAVGVLVFRYSVDPGTARRVLEEWARRQEVGVATVSRTLVHGICVGSPHGASTALVRWLEEQLRHECPVVAERADSGPVRVLVDRSYSALDAVVDAAREAARRGVPLVVELDPDAAAVAAQSPMLRAPLLQQVDLAVELARAVEPGLVVRLPCDSPFDGPTGAPQAIWSERLESPIQ